MHQFDYSFLANGSVPAEIANIIATISSLNWHESENSYFPFIKNFLQTLYRCYKELDKRFSTVNSKKLSKKELVKQTVLNNILPISKQEISQILPEVSITTIEAVLGELVKSDHVKKIGQSKLTKYVNAERLK